MARLVALDHPGGASFLDELQQIWDRGDAVLPVDQRLPPAAVERLYRDLRVGEPVDDGDALVLATSGTTGTPKGVVLTHDALDAHADAVTHYLQAEAATDRWLACLPLAHIGGLGVVLRARRSGIPVDIHPGFDAAAVAASSATLVSLVPTVLPRIDSTQFRRILLGGSAIPKDRPANATATYGMTETGGGIVYDGKPLRGVAMRTTEDGEIQLHGPTMLRAYRNAKAPLTEDGWLRTGDIGAITDGVLTVQGRMGDMIITGGENVWPTPVETLVERHPSVAAAAVVGRSDPDWGQRVTAVIEVVPGEAPPSVEELRALVGSELPTFCAPKAIEVIETLPRTALGKLQRSLL